MNDFWYNFGAFVAVVIVIALVIGLLALPTYFGGRAECIAKTAHIGFPHQYGFWSGCMIEVKSGQWIPLENYYFKQE